MPTDIQGKKAALFPGQGSQEKNMGRELAESSSEAMQLWKEAEKIAGVALREIYWDGDEQSMAQTRYLQPSLTVVCLNLWQKCSSLYKPDYLAGHSLGEYMALAAAEVLSYRDVIKLVSLRGRLMWEAGETKPGSMAAILKLRQEQVEEIVQQANQETGKEVRIANYNTPAQLVVSGAKDPVQQVCKLTKDMKGKAVPLPVSGAFHTSLMQEASEELASFMDRFHWRDAQIPIHFNLTGKPAERAPEILDNLKKQMTSPVLWTQIIADQWDKGVRLWLEVGPKGVLSRMMKTILQEKDQDWKADNLSTIEQTQDL